MKQTLSRRKAMTWASAVLLATAVLSGCGHTMVETPLIYRNSDIPQFDELAPSIQPS